MRSPPSARLAMRRRAHVQARLMLVPNRKGASVRDSERGVQTLSWTLFQNTQTLETEQLSARIDLLTGPAGIEPATPGFEPTPSNAGVVAFVDFQRLSFWPPTPALLDNAGVGTNPGTISTPGLHFQEAYNKPICRAPQREGERHKRALPGVALSNRTPRRRDRSYAGPPSR
jgi:hypothetical protein